MPKRNFDLIGALCVASVGIVWMFLPFHPLLVGAMLAIPLVFFFPGYTLTRVLLHRGMKRGNAVDAGETISLLQSFTNREFGFEDNLIISIGLSLVIDIGTGLLLNLTPLGLQLSSWTLTLGLFTALWASFALFLRRKSPARVKAPIGRFTLKQWFLLLLALALVLLSLWLSIIRPPQPQTRFTQLWILPAIQANKSCVVNLGIRNFESGTMTYRVQLTGNGKSLAIWPSIKLGIQQQWGQLVPVTPDTLISARLYRLDHEGKIYREVHLKLSNCNAIVSPTP